MRQYLIIFDNLETVADLEALAPLIDMLATGLIELGEMPGLNTSVMGVNNEARRHRD